MLYLFTPCIFGVMVSNLQIQPSPLPDSNWIMPPRFESKISEIACSSNGKFVVTRSTSDPTIKIWDTNTLTVRHSLAHTSAATSIAICQDSSLVASYGEHDSIRIWNSTNGKLTRILKDKSCHCLAFSSDSKFLAVGGLLSGELRVWDIEKATLHISIFGNSGITSLAFSPKKDLLAAACVNGKVRVWNLNSSTLSV
jgi:WD40 repeat protein